MAKMAKTNVGPLARSSRWRLLLLVVVLGLVAYMAIGDGLIFAVWEQEQKLEALQVQVRRLEAENDSLQGVLEQLDNDMSYIEKVAREELGLIKPGEIVIPLGPEGGD